MRHSGNVAKPISYAYTPDTMVMKIYVYDELDRFVTVAELPVEKADLAFWLGGMELARQNSPAHQDTPLPPWQ